MRLPDDTQRIAIVGKTGSGKTQAATYLLSTRNFDQIPWVVFDFKFDDLLNDITRAKHIGLMDDYPSKPGIYLIHPDTEDDALISQWLTGALRQQNIGIYIDEGYMIKPRNPGLTRVLTQGRSKHVPAIFLSQRPTWVSRFVFSESEFLQVFHLNDARDRKTVLEFMPTQELSRLPDYHSYYYDVAQDKLSIMRPVPSREVILKTFEDRLAEIQEGFDEENPAPTLKFI